MDNKYREYLISKKWGAIKRAIHFLYEDECYICRSRENLHVHHKNYDRLYHEDLDDLVLVCGRCHDCIHDGKNTKEENYEMLLEGTYKSQYDDIISKFEVSNLFSKYK